MQTKKWCFYLNFILNNFFAIAFVVQKPLIFVLFANKNFFSNFYFKIIFCLSFFSGGLLHRRGRLLPLLLHLPHHLRAHLPLFGAGPSQRPPLSGSLSNCRHPGATLCGGPSGGGGGEGGGHYRGHYREQHPRRQCHQLLLGLWRHQPQQGLAAVQ